jgi:hypothetical protein
MWIGSLSPSLLLVHYTSGKIFLRHMSPKPVSGQSRLAIRELETSVHAQPHFRQLSRLPNSPERAIRAEWTPQRIELPRGDSALPACNDAAEDQLSEGEWRQSSKTSVQAVRDVDRVQSAPVAVRYRLAIRGSDHTCIHGTQHRHWLNRLNELPPPAGHVHLRQARRQILVPCIDHAAIEAPSQHLVILLEAGDLTYLPEAASTRTYLSAATSRVTIRVASGDSLPALVPTGVTGRSLPSRISSR